MESPDKVPLTRSIRGRLWLAYFAGLATLPIAAMVAAYFGLFPIDAVSRPPGLETAIGQRALSAALASRSRGLSNPVQPGDERALLAGMRLFRRDCAGCHGDVHGDSPWGAHDFYPRVPQFWSNPIALTPAEAYVAIHYGIRYSGMAAWHGLLADDEIWQAANFVSAMHHLPASVDREWRNPSTGP